MRIAIYILIFAFEITVGRVTGQTSEKNIAGTVSYVTSQNIYVKFESTENISIGDTLFNFENGQLLPALTVKNKSSISCICNPLSSIIFKTGDVLVARPKKLVSTTMEQIESKEIPLQPNEKDDTLTSVTLAQKEVKQDVYGRFTAASYTNFSNSEADDSQRMRYTLSLNVRNIAKSKLSLESYLSFVHSNQNWDDVQENLFNGLKIYNLSIKYDFNESTSLIFGRKINPNLSSVGAIDGLQFEKKLKSFSLGAFVGSRPDYKDYSYSYKLFQYGAFVGHYYDKGKKSMQSSVAYVEQKNNGNTDRRFIYFQHTNSLLKKVYFFGSVEMDLYKEVKSVDTATNEASYHPENTFKLTNLYLLLRYNINRKISLSASYSARQNIIYYETDKNIIERLLDSQTLQGYRLMINIRPVKNLSIGLKGSYRFRTNDPRRTKDFYGYLTYSNIPKINTSATFSLLLLESAYMNGNVYSLGLNRDLISGKVSIGANYRYVDYRYTNSEVPTIQNIGELDLTWRIVKKLSLSMFYEGTIEKVVMFNRIYANIGYRF